MGYTEIQLLGQNVNSYHDPSPAGWDFARLLRAMGEIDGIRRVRFTTSHPRDFVKEIIEAIDENPVLCNHVHLPVQSGSSSVLARMQRLYTRDAYMRRIDWMKRARRNISITTDIIVGFPGETDSDFNDTLSLLDEVEYDSLFSFKYSKRPNTSALALEDHISEDEKGSRLAIVQERQRSIQIRRNATLVGAAEESLVEGFNKATGQWIGRTSQNRTLNFSDQLHPSPDSGETLVGQYLQVRVTRAGPNSLAGEAIN
jgi:tRNA-2-methylthio-N6-dimethylallyladenosine synthase